MIEDSKCVDKRRESKEEELSLFLRLNIWIELEAGALRLESMIVHAGEQEVDSVACRAEGRDISR